MFLILVLIFGVEKNKKGDEHTSPQEHTQSKPSRHGTTATDEKVSQDGHGL